MHAVLEAFERSCLSSPDAIGHRFVHGGPRTRAPVRVDEASPRVVFERSFGSPRSISPRSSPARRRASRFAKLAQVVCFDTAFHRELPEVAQRFGLPRDLSTRGCGAMAFTASRTEYVVETVGAESLGRAVIAHLGSGASLAAVGDGALDRHDDGLHAHGGASDGDAVGRPRSGRPRAPHGPSRVRPARAREARERSLGPPWSVGYGERHEDAPRRERGRPAGGSAVEMFCYTARKFIGALAAALEGLGDAGSSRGESGSARRPYASASARGSRISASRSTPRATSAATPA